MKLLSLDALAVALLLVGVTGMVVPTAAVGTEDQVWEEPAIVLEPTAGPNGQYASLDADGNLTVDIADVNTDSVTDVREVFSVTNNEADRYEVWVSHDAEATVEFYVRSGRTLQDGSDPVVLGPGERRNVSLRIDGSGSGPNETILDRITLYAEPAPEPTASGSGGTTSTDDSNLTTTPTPTPTATAEDDGDAVSIEFGIRTAGPADPPPYTVRALELSALDEDPTATPRAAIRHADTTPVVMGLEAPPPRAASADAVTTVGEPVYLSGSRSVIGQVAGVDRERRLASLVAIDVPPDYRNVPSRLRLTVARSAFGGADPARAAIGRRTADGGWQLLDTDVVSVSDRSVTLEAVTPSFTTFAVFVEPEVRYRWTLPDGTTVDGQQLATRFEDPGRYDVELTLTDAMGRTDAGRYRVVVNDEPTVVIEGLEAAAGDGPSTLRANVSDEVGNVTVTWVFADGSSTTGPTVTREFRDGEVVRVIAVDEYGAETRVRGTVGEPFRDQARGAFGPVRFDLGLQSQVAFTGLAVVLSLMAGRRVIVRRYGLG